MKKVFFASAMAMICFFAPTLVNGQVVVVTRPVPPAKVIAVRPAAPGPNHLWVDGYWRWNDRQNRYLWVDGYWAPRKKNRAPNRVLIVKPRH